MCLWISSHSWQNYHTKVNTELCGAVREFLFIYLQTNSADTLIHVTSCRKRFLQEQVGTVWDFVSNSPLAKKQVHNFSLCAILGLPLLWSSVSFELQLRQDSNINIFKLT